MKKIHVLMTVAALCLSSVAVSAQNETEGKGFWLDVSLGTGDYAGLPSAHTMCEADFALGYRVNPYIAVGAGAGAILGIQANALNIPTFLRLRYDLLNKFASPFISADIGYVFTPFKQNIKIAESSSPTGEARYMTGLYDSITIGCSFKIEKGHRMWIGFSGGYYMTGLKEVDAAKSSGTATRYICNRDLDRLAGVIKLGYCF